MTTRLRRPLRPLLLLLVVLAACGRSTGSALTARPGAPQIMVVNNNRESMNVYVVQAGMRVRLGIVAGHSQEQFGVPERLLDAADEIQLLAHPLGSSDNFRSTPILLSAGLEIELRIESTLSMSSIHIR